MKKTAKMLTAAGLVLAALGFASCDSKLCYCYERINGTVQRTEQYTNTDTPCASLGNATRGCIERDELGTVNPDDIAK